MSTPEARNSANRAHGSGEASDIPVSRPGVNAPWGGTSAMAVPPPGGVTATQREPSPKPTSAVSLQPRWVAYQSMAVFWSATGTSTVFTAVISAMRTPFPS